MKKFNFKFYVAGVLTVLVLLSSSLSFAEIQKSQQSIDVFFGGVELIANGEIVDKNALLYNDTTYISFRKVFETLDKEAFDAETSTAYINEKGTDKTLDTPDYSLDDNWAYFGIGGVQKDSDLFLICPTVFKGVEDSFNMPIDAANKQRFINALNMERGIYEESCRMYAPFYRQVGFNVYGLDEANANKYFDIAYADIRNAFKTYMDNYNNGRSFVLAGFSQGSNMALRLMKEFFVDERVSELCVAAYLIGWRVTEDDIIEYPFLKMAQGETDTGVIVSFNTEAEDVDYSIIVPERTYGINPLNWNTDSTFASRESNKGACFPNSDGSIDKEITNLTGAYLDSTRGTLKVTDISTEDYPPGIDLFDEGVYHIYDYQFFYRNLKENVAARVQAFMLNFLQNAA